MSLDFLETFHKASEASIFLNAIDMASSAASPLPPMISMVVSIAANTGAKRMSVIFIYYLSKFLQRRRR